MGREGRKERREKEKEVRGGAQEAKLRARGSSCHEENEEQWKGRDFPR